MSYRSQCFFICLSLIISCQQSAPQNNHRTQDQDPRPTQKQGHDDLKNSGAPSQAPIEIQAKDDYWNQKQGENSQVTNIDAPTEKIQDEDTCTSTGYFWQQGNCLQNHLWFIWEEESCLAKDEDLAVAQSCDVVRDEQQFVARRRFRGGGYQVQSTNLLCLKASSDRLTFAACDEGDSGQRFNITVSRTEPDHFQMMNSEERCLKASSDSLQWSSCDNTVLFSIRHVLDADD